MKKRRGHGLTKAKQNAHAENDRNPSGEGNDKSQPHRPLVVQVDVPPSDRDEERTHRQKENAREKLKIGLEIATLVLLGIYTGVNIFLYIQTKRSVDIASNQLQAMRRAWVVADVKAEPMTADGAVPYTLSLKNTGPGVARWVTPYLRVMGRDTDCLLNYSDISNATPSAALGLMAPDTVYPTSTKLPLNLFIADYSSGMAQMGMCPLTPHFCLFGFVTYVDEFDVSHGTLFCFEWDPSMPHGFTWCATLNEGW